MPCNKKCSKMKIGLSGRRSSMWNKKRCKVYSSRVHTKFPNKNEARVKPTALGVTEAKADGVKGSRGATMKLGIGRENATIERTKRLRAIGSQMSGTRNH